MFESAKDMESFLQNFIKNLNVMMKVVDQEFDLSIWQREEGLEKKIEPVNQVFWFLAFIFITVAEHLLVFEENHKDAKYSPGVAKLLRNLIEIRNGFSHKLYLIELKDYREFIRALKKDLSFTDTVVKEKQDAGNIVITFSSCKKFFHEPLKRSLKQDSLVTLFSYWSSVYMVSYQQAIRMNTFGEKFESVFCALMNQVIFAHPASDHHVLPSFSLIILLGQLSLRISQHIYPRNIQVTRASREIHKPLEKLLFDMQTMRNDLVHGIVKNPDKIPDYKAILIITAFYLREIIDLLSLQNSLLNLSLMADVLTLEYYFSPLQSAEQNEQRDAGEAIAEKRRPKKPNRYRLFEVQYVKALSSVFCFTTDTPLGQSSHVGSISV